MAWNNIKDGLPPENVLLDVITVYNLVDVGVFNGKIFTDAENKYKGEITEVTHWRKQQLK